MQSVATLSAVLHDHHRPRIVLPGGSGFLGRSLTQYLVQHGYSVTILSRQPHDSASDRVEYRQWDNLHAGDWAAALEGAAAIVNLVGRSVDCRKTPANKKVIVESRINSCRALGEGLRAVSNPPPVWIQSATAHIVGDPIPEDTICDDDTPPGTGFAPEVGVAWERAFNEHALPTQRRVALRISFVLGRNGGALARLNALTRWGLGGTVGSGRQYISWIHEHDLNRIIHAAIHDDAYEGVYMTTAPNPVTNRAFMAALRRAHGRPWSPPAPTLAVKFAARFVLRTDPELALLGRRCVPRRLLEEHAFDFAFTDVDRALADVVHCEAGAMCDET